MAEVRIIEKRKPSGGTELDVLVDGKRVIELDGDAKVIDGNARLFQILSKALGASVFRERHTVEVIP